MQDRIKDINVPTCWLYGDHDWMSRDVADELLAKGDLKPGSFVASVEQAGHHLYADNPLGCVAQVYKFVFGEIDQIAFLQEVDYFAVLRNRRQNEEMVHPATMN